MATRRPIYRKQEKRSISKTGLLFCMLLAGGVMLVPIGSNFVYAMKMKVRDLALSSGMVDFKDCVVTPDHALACSSHAFGTPLAAALRAMEDTQSLAAAEQARRLKAESTVRELALEIARLNEQVKQAQLAAGADGFFPPLAGEVRPTGLTGASDAASRSVGPSSSANIVNHTARTKPVTPEADPNFTLTPPSEDE